MGFIFTKRHVKSEDIRKRKVEQMLYLCRLTAKQWIWQNHFNDSHNTNDVR